MPPIPHLRLILVAALIVLCAVLALAGFGRDFPGPVAALLLSMVVAAGGYYLRRKPGV
jgi:uncharacterized membrane protein